MSTCGGDAEKRDEEAGLLGEAATSPVEGIGLLTEEIQAILDKQDRRRVTAFEVSKLEIEAKKNWDIFYKRNETRFFKDRHWTLREFQEILELSDEFTVLLEVGCGCGNFVIPLLDKIPGLKAYACDFSSRAVELLQSRSEYNEERIKAFVCDLTVDDCFSVLNQRELRFGGEASGCEVSAIEAIEPPTKVDFVSMVFVLSTIAPVNYEKVIENLGQVVKPGGVVFFRDYGRFDMAQLRFKEGNKIDDNFYARRDGTRAYYFTVEETETLFTRNGAFTKLQCEYVHRRTVNFKEKVDIARIFVQGKFIKV